MNIFKRYKTIDELAPGFLLEKEMTVQGRSLLPYLTHIEVFKQYLTQLGLRNAPLRKIDNETVKQFFIGLWKDKDLDRNTIEKYLLDIRQLFKYAQRNGELDVVPFQNVVLPRKKKDQGADAIQPSDMAKILPIIKAKNPQIYLACMTQYYCFIRPGKELRLLKVGDVNLKDGLIKIRQENAKNKKEQMVTMPQQLIDLYYEYGIDKVEDKGLYLFGKKGRPNTRPNGMNYMRVKFNEFREALKMPKSYKFYSFKHSGATSLHLSGISMREMMDQLRHTKLEATQHYLKKRCGIVNDRIRMNFPNPY